jgi:hypothetical protein
LLAQRARQAVQRFTELIDDYETKLIQPLTDLAKTVEAMLVQIDYFGDVEAIPAPAAMLQSSSIAGTVKN